MKIKLLAAAVISTLAFSAQSADFLGADHNWNNGSSAAKAA